MRQAAVHHLEVPRTARIAVLGEPGPGTRELWVVLHGYRQLAPRFIRRFSGLVTPWRVVAAPDALNRFYVGDAPGRHGPDARVGGTWMTREERDLEIADYVRYLDLVHEHLVSAMTPPVRTVVLGFSQGCHTAARWSAYGRTRPEAVLLWGELLPGDLDPVKARDGLAGARLISVQGREDTHVTPGLLAAEDERFRALGLTVERRWHPLGHVVEPELLESLARELSEVGGTAD